MIRAILAVATGLLLLAFALPTSAQLVGATAAHTVVNVTTGSTLVLAATGGGGSGVVRKGVSLTNASDTDMWCSVGAAAVVGTGIYLATSATSPLKRWDSHHIVPRAAINCIHGGSGDKVIAVTEWK